MNPAASFPFPNLKDTYLAGKVSPELWQRQAALEEEMVTLGFQALHRAVNEAKAKGRENNTVYGAKLVGHHLPALIRAIREEKAKVKSGKAGRLAAHVKILTILPEEVLAALTLAVIMQTISRTSSLNAVALAIGTAIEEEKRRRDFREQAPDPFKWTEQRAKKSSHQAHKRRLFSVMAAHKGVESVTLSLNDKLHVGVKLVELVVQHTGLIALHKVSRAKLKGRKEHGFSYVLSPTAECLEWISRRVEFCELLSPKYLPTLVPPKAWSGPKGGGYWSPEVNGRVLVKTRYAAYLEELDNRTDDMPEVYRAVNAIQNTAWKVNIPVLEAAEALWDKSGDAIAGLPPREPLPLPPCPVCGAHLGVASPLTAREHHPCFDSCPPETLREWRGRASRAYDLQVSYGSRRLAAAKTLYLAGRFRNDTIYFPHQLDFRGRAYPMPSYLTPQGQDLAKGLLTFAEGKPLGRSGGRWLGIHLANAWGEDKSSLEARVAWVEAHSPRILATAADPLADLWWTEADKPFQFLAACLEWAGWKTEGEAFVSHLPVAMDGTCNGLQLFSLMLRDEEGGRATNLLPSDQPQDIYGIVAARVRGKLERLTERGSIVTREVRGEDGEVREEVRYDERVLAPRLLSLGVNRKSTKRQVMVVPYGGTPHSCYAYTYAWLLERLGGEGEARRVFPDAESLNAPAAFLSRLIWESIGETVIASRNAMSFLQKLAALASQKDLPINWTTPLGFPVQQAYQAYKMRQVKTHMFGNVYKPWLPDTLEELDKQRQRNGVSPNYVHSLDAAAMQHTICLALEEGLSAFSMVHDSYGTHAADAETLARSLRNAFVDLFGGTTNLLAVIREEVRKQTGLNEKALPALPALGSLQVEAVRDSLYFFA